MKNNLKILNVLIILITLAISLCLILSACSSRLTQPNNEQSNNENTESVKSSNQGDSGGDGTVSSSESSVAQESPIKVIDDSDNSTSTESTSNETTSSIDYSNPSNFRIDVNLTAQLVSVYYNDNLIKSLKCSGGTAENPTIPGTFTTNQKIYYAWVPKFNQGAYYWVRFYGAYLFHSVPFDKNRNMIAEEASKIGTPASHGCVRMALEDAKWFYEILPLGIKVTIHY